MIFRRSLLVSLLVLGACSAAPEPCLTAGRWFEPGSMKILADPLPASATRAVLLLGEHHDSLADHRWQLASIQAIFAGNSDIALGFEMFPRSVQPALDLWVSGGLDEAAFLAKVDWEHVWGRDPELYLPIFRFARDHRVPMIALNVDRSLPRRVAQEGWAAIPRAEREGVGDPEPATPTYRAWLAQAMGGHAGAGGMNMDRFIEAQLVWDRAMAEGIAGARKAGRGRTVVAIMGSGHLEGREGVPRQLAALGIADVAVFLPVGAEARCDPAEPGLADALYATGG